MRCYHCGGLGHRENECLALPSRQANVDGRIRRAQPTFTFEIRGLGTVLVRDRHGSTLAVGGFGVEMFGGAIRVVQSSDRISFFGRPPTGRNFSLALPTVQSVISFQWDDRRLSCENVYAMNAKLFKAAVGDAPEPSDAPEFTLVCSGQFVRDFIIRFGTDDNMVEFLAIRNGRGTVCIVPMLMYDGVSEYRAVLARAEEEEPNVSETEESEVVADEKEEANPERDEYDDTGEVVVDVVVGDVDATEEPATESESDSAN